MRGSPTAASEDGDNLIGRGNRNHAFIDGNEHVAFALTAVFLHRNGYRLDAGADAAERFLIDRVIVAKAELEQIAGWIEKHLRPRGQDHAAYEQERWRVLAADWAGRRLAGAYVIDAEPPEDDPDERSLEIVFTDPDALGRIRFGSFLADTRGIECPSVEFDRAVTEEIELLYAYIAAQLEDLRRNFNPKIVRLRKRARIMMHPQAFDSLSTDDEDPD